MPVRQWVLSLPFRIRYLLAYDAKLCFAVRRILVHAILAAWKWGVEDQGRFRDLTLVSKQAGPSYRPQPTAEVIQADATQEMYGREFPGSFSPSRRPGRACFTYGEPPRRSTRSAPKWCFRGQSVCLDSTYRTAWTGPG